MRAASIVLSARDMASIRRRRAAKESWRTIADDLGCSSDGLRRQVDPEFRARRNAAAAQSARRPRADEERTELRANRYTAPLEIPATVLFDRERRRDAPRSLTALICGDPPPGYSALDRRRS